MATIYSPMRTDS